MDIIDSALLSKIIETSPVGICIINAELFTVELLNEKYAQLYGKHQSSILEKTVDQLIVDGHHLDKKIIKDVANGKSAVTTPSLALKKKTNGILADFRISITYSPIADKNGIVSKVALWVTEQCELENNLYPTVETNKESEYTKALLYEIPTGVAVLSGRELTFELLNPSFQNILPGRELIGKPFLDVLPELIGSKLEHSLKKVLNEGITLNFSDDLVPLSDQQSGLLEERYFTYRLIPRFNALREVDGLFIFT